MKEDYLKQFISIILAMMTTCIVNVWIKVLTGYWGSYEFVFIFYAIQYAEIRIVNLVKK
jgi:hypothetical protein